jgi:protein involved in polysaccharide export with SLBB domain
MTPAEIDQKLKELGLTREDAIAKAREYGITLEDYLSRLRVVPGAESQDAFSGRGEQMLKGDPRLDVRRSTYQYLGDLDTMAAARRALRLKKRIPVPGFEARYGVDSLLQPYGFEIFEYESSFFTPSASSAPPPSYALGPGDEITVTLWGETRYTYQGVVNKEGSLVVPDVGPVSASGLTIQQFQDKLQKRMSSVYASLLGGARARTFLDVSLGKLKNVQIFVVGEVVRPGGYSVPSMSTLLTALYVAGGPTVNGSMRQLAIMRKGERQSPADLYGYLLRMEKSGDQLLMDGDIVFVTPAARRVAIVGEIVHPAIYELKEGETLADLLRMAGGLRFYASTRRLYLERIIPFAQRKLYDKDVLHFDLEFASADEMLASREPLVDGDVVRVFRINYLPYNRVNIAGPVWKPGRYALTPGMRVADLIHVADSLRRSIFYERGTISRVLPDLRREVVPFNLRLALAGDESQNLLLMNEDSVTVYAESLFTPQRMVTVEGAVKLPGKYLRREKMTVSDLIVFAGGLTEFGIVTGIEVARIDTVQVGRYATVHKVNLPPHFWEGGADDFPLQDYDIVSVPENPKFSLPKSVVISGYIMSPGTYAIRYSGERLADLFKRAGGLRVGAYLEASRLIRKFNNAGLVPLNFKSALEDESSRDNVVLYDGDSVNVALTEEVVYVSGEVFVPSPVLYEKGAGLEYYLDQAGGTKDLADEERTVVLLPGGKKWEEGGLFGGDDILPGSSIFVPKKIEKEDKTLPLIRDIATILASLAALTVAMVQVTK